ncbi:MAG: GNAT family N-acetyltransferase [Thermoplasmatales archaeon]
MIRKLEWRDMNDLVENYYSYYDELTETPDFGLVLYRERPTYASEVEWFSNLFRNVEMGDAIAVVAEENGKAIGLCDANRVRPGTDMDHVAVLGIAIRKEFRNRGIGEKMIRKVVDLARGKFEVLKLEVFSSNSGAIRLYKKIGFVEYGAIPKEIKRGGMYYDVIYMYYSL